MIACGAPAQENGLQAEVRFDLVSPLSSNTEMARRVLSPLTAAELPARLAKAGKTLAEQPIDPAKERFVLYVPPRAPAGGYGLLVFVPPWQQAALPPGWAEVMDKYGLIYVSAAHSGNEESVLGRRIPLAVLAAANVEARYRIDLERVYVGGLSGGSRIALRLALAYPDLFRGALLNAGSDPIGGSDMPLPPRDLFLLFQARSRLVYFTGGQDAEHLAMDGGSLASLRPWCAFGAEAQVIPGGHHEIAHADALERALNALEAPMKRDPARLAACRAGLDRDMDARFAQVEALLASGKHATAMTVLGRIDQRYGGLAAPRSLGLANR